MSTLQGGIMVTIVQFSPTGNTAYIANQLGELLETSRIYALEHTDPTALLDSEHLVLLFPIHAFNAPKRVIRFVGNLPKGKFKKISLISVGCNDLWMNYGASLELRKILTDKCESIVVDETIAMPLTFIMSFPDNLAKRQIAKAKITLEVLAEHISNNIVSHKDIPFKSRMLSKVGKIEPYAAKLFGLELHAKKSCTKCGMCIKECPEHNIKLNGKGKIKFGFNCMMCMRCIYNCPQKSISPRISKFIPIKNGYSIERYISKDK